MVVIKSFGSWLWIVFVRTGLYVPLLFIGFMIGYGPMSESQSFDFDEGVNLMKGVLFGEGYQLYTDIWSDQPPVMTALLAVWRQWFGTAVQTSRMLIVLLSSVLLWSFYQIVIKTVSIPAALIAVLLLVVSDRYIRLSSSIMIGLPSIALAMVSIYMVILAVNRKSTLLLILSGLLMALSLQTKLYTVIMVPAILSYYLVFDWLKVRSWEGVRDGMRHALIWLGATAVGFVAIGLIYDSFNSAQIFTPHFGAQTQSAFSDTDNIGIVIAILRRHLLYFPVAIIGIVWMIKGSRPLVILPVIWLATTLVFLLVQKPLWYHYVTMFTIPLSWLCAYGFEAFLTAIQRRRQDQVSGARRIWAIWIISMLGVAYIIAIAIYPAPIGELVHSETYDQRPEFNEQIVHLLQGDLDPDSGWLYTDSPYYATQSGVLVPPPLAVFTLKRLHSGALNDDVLLHILSEYKPKIVLTERFAGEFGPLLMDAIEKEYDLLYTSGKAKYYIAKAPIQMEQVESADATDILYGDWLKVTIRTVNLTSEPGDILLSKDFVDIEIGDGNLQSINASLRLVDDKGKVWEQWDEPLVIRQRGEEIYRVDTLPIHFLVPEGTPPGNFDIDLLVYDPDTLESLQPNPSPSPDSETVTVGQVAIQHPARMTSQRDHMADFGPLHLIEAGSAATIVSPGDTIPLSVLWQFTPSFESQGLVVVSQLLDFNSDVVASLEQGLFDEQHPPNSWSPGHMLRANYALTLPADIAPGNYQLIVGVYEIPGKTRYANNSETLPWRTKDYMIIQKIEVR